LSAFTVTDAAGGLAGWRADITVCHPLVIIIVTVTSSLILMLQAGLSTSGSAANILAGARKI
jgi:hypothetical protein